MTKKLTLSIPKPCNEDWDKMTSAEKGRFCGSCQKEVIDFTSMSESQLIAFFKKPKGSVCGRFRNEQLEKDIYIRPKRMPWVKYFFQIVIPVFLLSCKQRTMGVMKVNTETVNDLSQDTGTLVMGEPLVPLTGEVKLSTTIKTGEICPAILETENWIVGDVISETELMNKRPADTTVTVNTGINYVQLPEVIVEERRIKCTLTVCDSTEKIMGEIISVVSSQLSNDRIETKIKSPVDHKLKVYPNPLARNSNAKADLSNLPDGEYKIQIADMGGRILYVTELVTGKSTLVEIPFSGLPGGMYILRFQNKTSGKVFSEKIVVQ